MNKIIVSIVLALALVGAVDARSTGSSARSGSVSKGISLAKPAAVTPKTGGINLTKPVATPAPVVAAPKTGINLTKPAPAANSVPSSPTRNVTVTHNVTVVHEHHYFGGGYGYGRGYYGGYSGGFGSSPFFWLWLLDRPQPQTVIVNGQPQNGASGSYAAPSTGETVANVLLGLLMIGAVVGGLIWLAFRVYRSK